jgi:diacylglycerol kinase (ATP)
VRRRGLLVYNPKAGSRDRRARMTAVIERAAKAGLTLVPLETERRGHATELVRAHVGEAPDLVAVGGGDGTLAEVAAASDVLDAHGTPIALLPTGTTNVIAREYRIGRDVESAEQHLFSTKTRPLAVFRAAGRASVLSVGVGFDARVMGRAVPLLKRLFGRTGIGWTATIEWLRYEFPEIAIEGVDAEGRPFTREATFAIAANTKRYGGEPVVSPWADPERPFLELVLFTGRGKGRLIRFYGRLSRGKAEHLEMPGVERLSVRELTARSLAGYELEVHVDGDAAGVTPLTVAPAGSVRLVVPE